MASFLSSLRDGETEAQQGLKASIPSDLAIRQNRDWVPRLAAKPTPPPPNAVCWKAIALQVVFLKQH